MHAYIHTYMHAYIHSCIHKYKNTYIHTYKYIHTHHTNIHKYIHTYIHTYIQTNRVSYLHKHVGHLRIISLPLFPSIYLWNKSIIFLFGNSQFEDQ